METNKHNNLELDINEDPYNHVMRMVFSRWKPFILRAMDFDEDKFTNFARFPKQLPISQKVLAQNLKDLEHDGLISRTVVPEVPPRTEYRLTDKGRSLLPLLDAIYKWGWEDMTEKGLPIDILGDMWHGYRERDEELMRHPYKNNNL